MLVIVRVKIATEIKNKNLIEFASGNQQKFWDYIINNQPNFDEQGVQILYLTHRHMTNDVSLIINSKTPDHLAEYLTNSLGHMDHVDGFWIINLFEPRIFRVPNNEMKKLSRFTLNISSKPKFYKQIYNKISNIKPNSSFMISYIAYTFQKFNSDIIVSILCTGHSTLYDIVEKKIKGIEGITNIEITRITKTKKLAPKVEWRSIADFIETPAEGSVIEESSLLEEDMMSGC